MLAKPPKKDMSAPGPPTDSPAQDGDAPQQPTNLTNNHRLQQTQMQVEEVADILHMNMKRVLQRDQGISKLDDKADALKDTASQFETSAAKLKRKYWWKNLKMMIILGVVCAVILMIIIVYFSS
ncbi:vesicle-associated membrane protein 2-like [Arapaima gigas]